MEIHWELIQLTHIMHAIRAEAYLWTRTCMWKHYFWQAITTHRPIAWGQFSIGFRIVLLTTFLVEFCTNIWHPHWLKFYRVRAQPTLPQWWGGIRMTTFNGRDQGWPVWVWNPHSAKMWSRSVDAEEHQRTRRKQKVTFWRIMPFRSPSGGFFSVEKSQPGWGGLGVG